MNKPVADPVAGIKEELDVLTETISTLAQAIDQQSELLSRLVTAATRPRPDDSQIALLREILRLLQDIAGQAAADGRQERPQTPTAKAEGVDAKVTEAGPIDAKLDGLQRSKV